MALVHEGDIVWIIESMDGDYIDLVCPLNKNARAGHSLYQPHSDVLFDTLEAAMAFVRLNGHNPV